MVATSTGFVPAKVLSSRRALQSKINESGSYTLAAIPHVSGVPHSNIVSRYPAEMSPGRQRRLDARRVKRKSGSTRGSKRPDPMAQAGHGKYSYVIAITCNSHCIWLGEEIERKWILIR